MRAAVLFEHRHRGHLWRLEVQSFKGRTFGNWRKWYAADGGWKPTKEGCTIPLDGLEALMAGLMAYHSLKAPDGLAVGS